MYEKHYSDFNEVERHTRRSRIGKNTIKLVTITFGVLIVALALYRFIPRYKPCSTLVDFTPYESSGTDNASSTPLFFYGLDKHGNACVNAGSEWVNLMR